ncbi:GNAT family N-acetyltransferase [Pseudobdellovibrio sp. HCB154]|uniref:GNAT family N-acetyltransferase n=1 Tax=Pseudobdellovibrio sp. HCB154 TaxID=3386277 RepID=UPI003916D13F
MTLKVASPSEYKELTELFFEIYDSVTNKAEFNWPMENIETELLMSAFLICRDEQGRICGFISYRDNLDAIEIMALGTASWARRKNVMSLLLREIQAKSREASKPLLLEVHSQNRSAINLYEKAGFKQIGTRKAYYVDRSDALTFQYLGTA